MSRTDGVALQECNARPEEGGWEGLKVGEMWWDRPVRRPPRRPASAGPLTGWSVLGSIG